MIFEKYIACYMLLFIYFIVEIAAILCIFFFAFEAFDAARAEGWFIGEMIWNFAGLYIPIPK